MPRRQPPLRKLPFRPQRLPCNRAKLRWQGLRHCLHRHPRFSAAAQIAKPMRARAAQCQVIRRRGNRASAICRVPLCNLGLRLALRMTALSAKRTISPAKSWPCAMQCLYAALRQPCNAPVPLAAKSRKNHGCGGLRKSPQRASSGWKVTTREACKPGARPWPCSATWKVKKRSALAGCPPKSNAWKRLKSLFRPGAQAQRFSAFAPGVSRPIMRSARPWRPVARAKAVKRWVHPPRS